MTHGPVYSTVLGNSNKVLPEILHLHIPFGSRILDCTFNRGTFWKDIPAHAYDLVRSDLADMPKIDLRADCRCLPFRDESFECVVFDPPFANMSTKPRTCDIEKQYNLSSCMTPAELWDLYDDGIKEGHRILAPNGIMILKCQDAINSGKQHWYSVHTLTSALAYGLYGLDRFFQLPNHKPFMRHKTRQLHARKWGSMWWVFQKGKK